MDLRFWRRESETKATPVLSPRLQAILEAGPISATPDGSIAYFEVFGANYGKIYRTQSALRSVVDFLSRNIAQCRIRMMERDSEGVSRPAPEHPVQHLLDHPQPGVPRSRFMRQLVADKAVYDVCATWKIRETFDPTPDPTTLRVTNSGPVRNLVRIPIPYISVWQGTLSSPVSFRVTAGRDKIVIPAEDVIWMPGYSPTSNTLGTPPVETLRQILAEEYAAGKDRENYWKNGVQGNMVFLQEGEVGMDKAQAELFKTEWRNKYGGVNAKNAREWPLLPVGVKPKELAIDASDAEYLGTRNLAREECCRAYGIQPQLLGITPANFASMDMFHQMLYQDTLAPWMVPIQEEFEEQLLREFEGEDSGFYLDFNINAKLQGSFLDQAKIGQQAVGGPWMTRNEFREKFQGLPPVPGGDDIIVPLNVVLGGGPQANPQDAQNQFSKTAELKRAEWRESLSNTELKELLKQPQPTVVNVNLPDNHPDVFVTNQMPEQEPLPITLNVSSPDVNVQVESPTVNVEPVIEVASSAPEVTVLPSDVKVLPLRRRMVRTPIRDPKTGAIVQVIEEEDEEVVDA